MAVGTQRTLARVRSASATQTPACAAATISGRASESRSAVARLIGNRRSVGSSGAGFSVRPTVRGEGPADARPAPPAGRPGAAGTAAWPGRAVTARALAGVTTGGAAAGGPDDGTGLRPWAATGTASGGGGGRFRPPSFMNRSIAGDTVDGRVRPPGARRGTDRRDAGAAVGRARARGSTPPPPPPGSGPHGGGPDPGEEQGEGEGGSAGCWLCS